MDRAFLLVIAAFSAVLMLQGTLGQNVTTTGNPGQNVTTTGTPGQNETITAQPREGSVLGEKTLTDSITAATDAGFFANDVRMMHTRKLLEAIDCAPQPASGRCRSPYIDTYCCEGSDDGAACKPSTGSTCPTRYPLPYCCGGASSSSSTDRYSPGPSGGGSSASTCCTKYCANRGGGYAATTESACCINDLKAGCNSPCNKFC